MYRTKKNKTNFLTYAAAFLLALIFIAGISLAASGRLNEPGGGVDISGGGDALTDGGQAAALAEDDPLLQEVLAHSEDYTPELIKLFINNPDARDFVLGYPEHKDDGVTGGLTDTELDSGGVPLLMQWDSRWGYSEYGSGPLGITGCGPTCLSMVLTALTGSGDYTPDSVAAYSLENGFYVDGSGTKWSLMTEGAASLGLTSQEVPLWEDTMAQVLAQGQPIVANMGPGDFTDSGHYIVITGYSDGMFIINDPNSSTRSAKQWSYDQLEGQIRAMWTFTC